MSGMVIKRKSAMVVKRRSAVVMKTKKGAPQMMAFNSLSELNAGASSTPSAHVRATVTTRMIQTKKPWVLRNCGLALKGADAPYAALYNPVEDDDASRH